MCGESARATFPASGTIPSVVAEPATSMFSFTVIGTPQSGPTGAPERTARSAASAASSADSASTTVTAFTAGFTCSIRRRCASTTSRLDASPARIRPAKVRRPQPPQLRHGPEK